MRAGIGYDTHRFVDGNKVILGGVEIPYVKRLEGHSDADVVIHAIADAILGAGGLGDIGIHFPPSDPRYKGISSLVILERVKNMILKENLSIEYIDVMVMLEEPKISPYIEEMKKKISETLNVHFSRISIKATTNEGMGFIGRKEGASAMAICLLKEPS
ncbi:MAG: 2-C-methyl-D-erythritol 2,4-cyclodiphosphate synthase [Mesoaciditoga sp.]|uniref:2-C-methyl-D-erythritol 2,4-cyclodiphosphate synthase n=1 Tax=Athalassotoga sp. TaxID=2022597 RepID=UPI000CA6A0C8|nr:MAG: 2-C-methyl-D-erythritol 2,4-cyclodiphosphate synthase [Mesoaciditoga sp.]PMP80797.1 MAG: 2-C-methyl-D-erythritol 2,4-cyclodiphosphate synthase [Mesoaciditoga sp.]HEU23891.1 2-C-methyl-D-erythritol 2,4-cyclodiphosphate synthase [Mesoaciditoga lauensis]